MLLRNLLSAVLFAALFGVTPAYAESINIDVQTIYATDGKVSVDAELEPLKSELQSGFPGYTSFELLGSKQLEVPLDKTSLMELPDKEGSVLQVAYRGRTKDDKKLLRLEVGLKGKIAAEVQASPGSTFFQAGLLYRDGILILAIRAGTMSS